MNTPMIAGLVGLQWALAFTSPAHAATSGDLDPTFGTAGIVTTDISTSNDRIRAVVHQADGKLVVAGTCGEFFTVFCLARYNADGNLDVGFGSGGTVTTAFGPSSGINDLVLQSDGKLVAAGGCHSEFCLARYNADGSLDTSFGIGGAVNTDVGVGSDVVQALVLQPDGKLVAAGNCGGVCLVRYNADGTLDVAGFGPGTGRVVDLSGGTAWTLALQSDGKLVTAGRCEFSTPDFCLARYNPDGSPDSTFDSDGIVSTDISGGTDTILALLIQPDGKLVAAGGCHFNVFDFCLARYNGDGSLDTSFGGGTGTVSTDFATDFDSAQAVALQADGKLVAAGLCDFATTQFCLARYHPDGSLDSTFGIDGMVNTDVSGQFDSIEDLIIQPDGKVVAAGYCYDPADFCLVRYDASAMDQTIALAALVNGMDLNPAVARSLTAMLRRIIAALERDRAVVACDTLVAFSRYVSGLSGKRIPVSQASELFQAAGQIQGARGCAP